MHENTLKVGTSKVSDILKWNVRYSPISNVHRGPTQFAALLYLLPYRKPRNAWQLSGITCELVGFAIRQKVHCQTPRKAPHAMCIPRIHLRPRCPSVDHPCNYNHKIRFNLPVLYFGTFSYRKWRTLYKRRMGKEEIWNFTTSWNMQQLSSAYVPIFSILVYAFWNAFYKCFLFLMRSFQTKI